MGLDPEHPLTIVVFLYLIRREPDEGWILATNSPTDRSRLGESERQCMCVVRLLCIALDRVLFTASNRHFILPSKKPFYRTNSRIALSSPAKVSGYMRPLIIWRIMRIE